MQIVADKMTGDVVACAAHERLSDVARLMWERDCGSVPVVDGRSHPVGLITDRDVCMAALMAGRPLHEIAAGEALPGRQLLACRADDTLEAAQELMRASQVRRLPVVDDAGALVGMLSLGDLARPEGTAAARRKQADALLLTLAGITRPTGTPFESVLPAKRAPRKAAKSKAAPKAKAKAAGEPAPAEAATRPAPAIASTPAATPTSKAAAKPATKPTPKAASKPAARPGRAGGARRKGGAAGA